MVATNHLGWCVEIYSRVLGWNRCTEVFQTKAEADYELYTMARIARYGGAKNLRVYEVLS
jgi:hypothetical protein